MVRYEAFVDRDWQEKGITHVAVTRTHENGWVEVGVFLVDLYCLGVKDAFIAEMPASEWADEAARLLPPGNRVSFHPACARKLVEGAVAYALALGFTPPRDYRKARRVFGSVQAQDCPQTFTYGQNGKPLYVAGPNDDGERIDRVLRVLTAKLGQDGFHYIVPAEPAPIADEEADELRAFFVEKGRETDFHALGGLFAASHVCSTAIPIDRLFPAVWAGDELKYRDEAEAKQVLHLLYSYWDETGRRISEATEMGRPDSAPHFADNPWENDEGLRQRAAAWCGGFLRALREWPEAWNGATDRADLRAHFDAISLVAAYAGDPAPAGVIAPAETEELPRYVGAAVLALYAALRPNTEDNGPAGGG
jgi:yecA family protein